MESTMQDRFPLTMQLILRRARTVNADGRVTAETEKGRRHVTYRELADDIDRVCHSLQELGVGMGDRVATLAWNTYEHLALYLGVPAMGAVLHTVNVRLHPEQITYILNHGGARILVVDASMLDLLDTIAGDLAHVRTVVVIGEPVAIDGFTVLPWAQLLDASAGDFEYPEIAETAPAGLCYTSGTTSNPRGVVYSHRSIVLHAMGLGLADSLSIGHTDRILVVVPLFHANGWGLAHAGPLLGADLVLPGRRLQADRLADLIENERVTISGAVPTVLSDLLTYAEQHHPDLSSLHTVSCGGAAAPRSLLEGFDALGVTVLSAWGMTELNPLGSVARPPEDTEDEERWKYRTSQGRLLPLLEARLDGPGGDAPWDGTTPGELLVRGPWVAASYYDSPGSDDRFTDGWLRTGDIASITPDGYIRIVDRAKDLIKSGGEWISSVDVENALMGHPDVVEAAVIARPDPRWTERPIAFIVTKHHTPIDTDELRDHLVTHIASWWVPDAFYAVSTIPKTSVGKLDKKRLREHAVS